MCSRRNWQMQISKKQFRNSQFNSFLIGPNSKNDELLEEKTNRYVLDSTRERELRGKVKNLHVIFKRRKLVSSLISSSEFVLIACRQWIVRGQLSLKTRRSFSSYPSFWWQLLGFWFSVAVKRYGILSTTFCTVEIVWFQKAAAKPKKQGTKKGVAKQSKLPISSPAPAFAINRYNKTEEPKVSSVCACEMSIYFRKRNQRWTKYGLASALEERRHHLSW